MVTTKNKKVCLLTDHHISINPRLWKEAFFYEKKGFDVVILSMWQSDEWLQNDRAILEGHNITHVPYLNIIPGRIHPLSRFFFRARKRIAGSIQRLLKAGTPWAISYAPELMVKKALDENADMYAAHLECAFYAGRELVQAGKKVSFDFEDWYSHDYLVPARPVKLLETLEKFALQNGVFCTAASKAMSDALLGYFDLEKEITVIYNGFSKNENRNKTDIIKFNTEKGYPKLIWFSRSIGPGRGIEFLLKALETLPTPVELNMAGMMKEEYKEFLEKEFPYNKGHKLVIHSFIPHNKLSDFISRFSIGLAIEENINDNKILTLSNKMLQYLQAGLLVIASDTKGQNEAAEFFPSSVITVDITKPGDFSKAIEFFKEKKDNYKLEQIETFNRIFSWEAQETKLSELIEKQFEH